MIVVLIIGILLAIAVPNFVTARESSRAKGCIANLSEMNSAKLQCILDNKIANNAPVTFSTDGVTPTAPGASGTYQLVNIAGSMNYLRNIPICPSGGAYQVGSVPGLPTCSVSISPTDTNYLSGYKYYHGL